MVLMVQYLLMISFVLLLLLLLLLWVTGQVIGRRGRWRWLLVEVSGGGGRLVRRMRITVDS